MDFNAINVAVTGNAPFLKWDYNTSLMVRDALPFKIERSGKKTIQIWKYARVTRDTYEDVRRVSKEIWAGQRSIFLPVSEDSQTKVDVDFILHLGMETRDEEQGFCFETTARRDGYPLPGDDARIVDSEALKELDLLEALKTKFDVDAARRRVHGEYPGAATRVSHDAGLYFCEFRLYSSLAEAELHHPTKRGRVLFQHIPQRHSESDVKLAVDVTIAYISALADDKILDP